MAQHLWRENQYFRLCEVCETMQGRIDGKWIPEASSVCPGDPGDGGRRRTRPKPVAPSGAPRVLEMA